MCPENCIYCFFGFSHNNGTIIDYSEKFHLLSNNIVLINSTNYKLYCK